MEQAETSSETEVVLMGAAQAEVASMMALICR